MTTPSKTEVIERLRDVEEILVSMDWIARADAVKDAIALLDQPAPDTKAVMEEADLLSLAAQYGHVTRGAGSGGTGSPPKAPTTILFYADGLRAFVQHLASRASPSQPAESEHPDLVVSKLEYLLRDFGPVRNDDCASHIVRLAIAALKEKSHD